MEISPETSCLDQIEADVFRQLRGTGFHKHGRTLHRFVSGDISQVINFQRGQALRGSSHLFWVNLGIRVPECFEREFYPTRPLKKYYQEYECNIRSRLGRIDGGEETCFDLRDSSAELTARVLGDLQQKVLPIFDVLSSREAILAHRREYPRFDHMLVHTILLDEAMIYGHMGDMEKARAAFHQYYQKALDEYEKAFSQGIQIYLKKGARLLHMGKVITAEADGYVTVYGASRGHLDYLDGLAAKLDLG